MELTSSSTTPRGTRSSVSAVLIVGLLIGVTVSTFKPGGGFRGLVRDPANEGQVTRHITATLARAVRELVGSDIHRPAIDLASVKVPRTDRAKVSECVGPALSARMLREPLLAMPPPVA